MPEVLRFAIGVIGFPRERGWSKNGRCIFVINCSTWRFVHKAVYSRLHSKTHVVWIGNLHYEGKSTQNCKVYEQLQNAGYVELSLRTKYLNDYSLTQAKKIICVIFVYNFAKTYSRCNACLPPSACFNVKPCLIMQLFNFWRLFG